MITPSEGVKVRHSPVQSTPTKHDGRAVLFAVAELLVCLPVSRVTHEVVDEYS